MEKARKISTDEIIETLNDHTTTKPCNWQIEYLIEIVSRQQKQINSLKLATSELNNRTVGQIMIGCQ
jgi:hypothetical protein